MTREKIFIVEDEQAIVEIIQYNLSREGLVDTTAFSSGELALPAIRTQHPTLVLLDIMLPGISGLELCRQMKIEEPLSKIPIIMLTARSEETDIIEGLQLGADDYITKPFSAKLLIARIRAVLRRYQENNDLSDQPEALVVGPICINFVSHQVLVNGQAVHLTCGEYNVLQLLMQNIGRVFTRAQLVQATRGAGYVVTDRAVDVQILGLRRKLNEYSSMVETIRGVGYRFAELERG